MKGKYYHRLETCLGETRAKILFFFFLSVKLSIKIPVFFVLSDLDMDVVGEEDKRITAIKQIWRKVGDLPR